MDWRTSRFPSWSSLGRACEVSTLCLGLPPHRWDCVQMSPSQDHTLLTFIFVRVSSKQACFSESQGAFETLVDGQAGRGSGVTGSVSTSLGSSPAPSRRVGLAQAQGLCRPRPPQSRALRQDCFLRGTAVPMAAVCVGKQARKVSRRANPAGLGGTNTKPSSIPHSDGKGLRMVAKLRAQFYKMLQSPR